MPRPFLPGQPMPGGYPPQPMMGNPSMGSRPLAGTQQRRPAVPTRQEEMAIARGARPEERQPAPVRERKRVNVEIMTPEELNIRPPGTSGERNQTRTASANLDWPQTLSKLERMGITRYQLERLNTGQVRFSCWVPRGGSNQMVQADGASPAEAIQICLDRARLPMAP